MKILALKSSNIKRLSVVEITPDGNLITIGGKNGAGKSSVLDSIAYALGGAALVPEEPIRMGATEAHVRVDLGDLIVTRKFRLVTKDGGETNTISELEVKSKDGAVFPSPQGMLNQLIGKLSFDPLQFARSDKHTRYQTLKTLVSLDTSEIDSRRAAAAGQRADLKKRVTMAEARVRGLVVHMNVPEEEVNFDDVKAKMAEVQKLNEHASRLKGDIRARNAEVENLKKLQIADEEEMARLVARMDQRAKAITQLLDGAKTSEDELAAMSIPDPATIQESIDKLTEINEKVRANKLHREAVAARDALVQELSLLEAHVAKADADKQAAMEAVKFPIEGLGFHDEEVTFKALPFEQASMAEQIRVSVAIGLALNPKLKVLLVRDGSVLDNASRQALAEQAAAADAQVWMEMVAESKDGVTVLIEDGHVA